MRSGLFEKELHSLKQPHHFARVKFFRVRFVLTQVQAVVLEGGFLRLVRVAFGLRGLLGDGFTQQEERLGLRSLELFGRLAELLCNLADFHLVSSLLLA